MYSADKIPHVNSFKTLHLFKNWPHYLSITTCSFFFLFTPQTKDNTFNLWQTKKPTTKNQQENTFLYLALFSQFTVGYDMITHNCLLYYLRCSQLFHSNPGVGATKVFPGLNEISRLHCLMLLLFLCIYLVLLPTTHALISILGLYPELISKVPRGTRRRNVKLWMKWKNERRTKRRRKNSNQLLGA